MQHAGRWFLGVLVLGLVAVLAAPPALAEKLPVFKLKTPKDEKVKARDLFVKTLGGAPTVEEQETQVTHKAGKKVVEVDKRSGHIFLGDMEKMWNPKAKANVPDEVKSKEVAEKFLKENKLLPETDKNVRVSFSHNSESAASEDAPGQVKKELMDRQVNYKSEIVVRGPGGEEKLIPVAGGGGKHKVSVGDRGEVIGYKGGWRETERVEAEEEALGKAGAEAEFKKKFGNTPVKNVRSELVYWAAPSFEEQSTLAPVWLVEGEIEVGKETIPARGHIVPATKHGPFIKEGPPAGKRGQQDPPPKGHNDKDEEGQGKKSWLDIPGQIGEALFPSAIAQDAALECGTEWIGPSQGLGGSPGNKQGFVDHCRAAGWIVNFDYGEGWAWESDWRAYDDYYIDGADLVFYTGHASQDGWVLNAPADTFMHWTEVGGALDLYGANDAEWIAIAACGPHQSTHFTTNTSNAFDRWRNIFDGLHIFLGYGAVTYDNTSEGRRFMELTRAGWNVVDAWFRMAWEIQPSWNGWGAPNGPWIYATAMYAHNGDHCARYEQLHGMGYTCWDVVGATQQRHMLWSGT